MSPAVAPRSTPRAEEAPTPRVLCVDDEPQVLESLRDSLRRRFDVIATTNGFEALRLLATEPFHVVLSDMRMPRLNGARFLTLAREHAPDAVRLLLTGQSTVDDAVAAVNEGEIFRFLLKPCPRRTLVAALDSAVSRHRALVHERQLAEQSLRGTVRAFGRMAAAVDPSAGARAARIRGHAMELAATADRMPLTRELEWACDVVQIGVLGLPSETRRHLAIGGRIGHNHAAELERLPELATGLTGEIPLLGSVTHLLAGAAQPFRPTTHGVAGTPPAARVLRIVLDFDLLEVQGASVAVAFDALGSRAGRYDSELLTTFAQLQAADA